MRIKSFMVEGYKNFAQALELKNLTSITVIHGPNNVGKSNLLEVLAFPFLLLGLGGENRGLPFERENTLVREELEEAGYPPGDIFNLEDPVPIKIRLEMSLTPEELAEADIKDVLDVGSVELDIEVLPGPPDVAWRIHSFRFGDGTNAVDHADEVVQRRARKFGLFLARNYLVGGGGGQRRFQIVGGSGLESRQGVPDELCLALYDAQESPEQQVYERWTLFMDLMARFGDVTGAEGVRAVYDRKAERADLLLQMRGFRLPVRLLGTGIQQLVVLVGSLVTSGAQVVGVEEPEANLSFQLQLRLREVLRELVADQRGPTQLLLTSHSPGFQVGPEFFALTPTPTGPELKTLPSHLSAEATGLGSVVEPDSDDTAPISWVTPAGLVRLPPAVVKQMGLEHGGGVGFLPAERGFRMLTNAQALEELEPDPAND